MITYENVDLRRSTLFSVSMVVYLAERRTYNGLPDIMTKIAKDELEKLGDDIAECNIIYLPQVSG